MAAWRAGRPRPSFFRDHHHRSRAKPILTDLVAIGRPHLVDPMRTSRAAAAQDYREVDCPPPYLNGLAQLARLMERDRPA
ncbi:MAG: hypothetical protein AVDCRST_MAG62-1038 [uncultured Sphingomonas sp.]|uniref:Uncharacterized protein n=1 Tax=uncultured Sphingomonas sp. TaxID=158754 RepID=A0A6J4TCI0_9SPHN|nr:MAG: hypothetical protein AVDCRST_MAG62-1038 [uncultured Sphingomonas sp.]